MRSPNRPLADRSGLERNARAAGEEHGEAEREAGDGEQGCQGHDERRHSRPRDDRTR